MTSLDIFTYFIKEKNLHLNYLFKEVEKKWGKMVYFFFKNLKQYIV